MEITIKYESAVKSWIAIARWKSHGEEAFLERAGRDAHEAFDILRKHLYSENMKAYTAMFGWSHRNLRAYKSP